MKVFNLMFVTMFIHSTVLAGAVSTGIFSDVKFNNEGGDLLGTEIRILKGKTGHFATIQIFEGGRADPIHVKLVDKNGKLSLSIPKGHMYESEYLFDIVGDGLKGKIIFPSGMKKDFQLKRNKSYWQ